MLGTSLIPPVWGLLTLVSVWRGLVLLRPSGRTRARVAVFVLFLSAWVANTAGLPAVSSRLDDWVEGLPVVVTNLALIGFFVGFILYFWSRTHDGPRYAQPRIQVGTAALATILMLGCWLIDPPGLVPYRAITAATPTTELWFYVVGELYLGSAAVVAALLARQAAGERETTHPWALRTCAVGMVLALFGGPVARLASLTALGLGGVSTPAAVSTGAHLVLFGGVLIVVLGLCWIGISTLTVKHRRRKMLRRNGAILECLAGLLSARFGEARLHPDPGRLGLLLYTPYFYGRRVTECCDGLWQLSRYVDERDAIDQPETGAALSIDVQARLVRQALARFDRGDDPIGAPVPIAGPMDGRDSAGDRELIALSAALQRIEGQEMTVAV